MNWSPGCAIAVGAVQVRPPSKDWLAIMSLLVTALYGSGSTGSDALRSSNHTTAKCRRFVGSAAMLPCVSNRNSLSWRVWRPSMLTGKSPSTIPS